MPCLRKLTGKRHILDCRMQKILGHPLLRPLTTPFATRRRQNSNLTGAWKRELQITKLVYNRYAMQITDYHLGWLSLYLSPENFHAWPVVLPKRFSSSSPPTFRNRQGLNSRSCAVEAFETNKLFIIIISSSSSSTIMYTDYDSILKTICWSILCERRVARLIYIPSTLI